MPKIPPSAERYQGTYKWILIKLTWDDTGIYNAAHNPWNGMNGDSQLEIYVSESGTASKNNRLTLGIDYLMWLCAVGDGISPNTQFKDNGGTGSIRTRCGWLDCQRKKPSSQVIRMARVVEMLMLLPIMSINFKYQQLQIMLAIIELLIYLLE